MNSLAASIRLLALALIFCTSLAVIAFTQIYWFYVVAAGGFLLMVAMMPPLEDWVETEEQPARGRRGSSPY